MCAQWKRALEGTFLFHHVEISPVCMHVTVKPLIKDTPKENNLSTKDKMTDQWFYCIFRGPLSFLTSIIPIIAVL